MPNLMTMAAVQTSPAFDAAGSPAPGSLLAASGISKTYGTARVLNDVTVHLAPGTILGLVGPNGAGKTTLLNILAGIFPPDSGVLTLNGEPVDFDRNPDKRRSIGLLMGGRLLIPELRPLEYFDFVAAMHGISSRDVDETVQRLVALLRLEPHLSKAIKNLSAGTQKKVEYIAALIHRPKILLLDEPFEAIDPPAVADLTMMTRDYIRETGAAALISSHILPYVRPLATEIRLLWDGRLHEVDELAGVLRTRADDSDLARWQTILEVA